MERMNLNRSDTVLYCRTTKGNCNPNVSYYKVKVSDLSHEDFDTSHGTLEVRIEPTDSTKESLLNRLAKLYPDCKNTPVSDFNEHFFDMKIKRIKNDSESISFAY